ncbi:hypothetical protein RB213_001034 [Colletotrichum asianum]
MRSLTSANTPAGCNNLSTASEDLTKNKPKKPDPSRLHRNIRPSSLSPATRNPALSSAASTAASSRASSPALLSPTSTPLRPVSPAPASASAGRKPTVAQIRARTTNNPASTPTRRSVSGSGIGSTGSIGTTTNTPSSRPKTAAAAGTSAATATRTAATGPPTATGPRPRITATTTRSRSTVTVTTIGAGTTKTSNSHSTTTTATANPTAAAAAATATAAANPNPNPNTTSSSQSPPATVSNTTTTTTTDADDAGTTAETPATSPQGSASARRQQPALSSSLRSPLRNRDQNVLNPSSRPANAARAKPSPTPSPTSSSAPASASASTSASPTPTTMAPYDKGGSTTTRQPGMPSLTAKGMNRAPLTPKVAAKPASVVTPLGRRRNDNTNNNTQHPTLHAAAGGGAKDDLTSPAPFLGNNITPRSGPRQNRVDSNNSTPNGTPNPDRTNDWDHQPTFQAEPVRRQVVTFSPVPSTAGNRHDADSKFFYASDAKPSAPAPQPKQPAAAPAAPQRASTFLYANGSAVDKNRPTSAGVGFTPMLAPSLAPSLSPTLAPTPESPQSKFFYANGAPNLAPGFRPSSAASGTGPTIAESRKKARNSAGSASGLSLASRPMSPNKPIQAPAAPPLVKSNSQPQTRTQMTSPPPLAPSMHKRKISMDAVSQVASHVNSRPASHVGSDTAPTDAMIMSQFMASQSPTPSGVSSPTMASFFPNQPITIASILQAADELSESEGEEEEEDDDDDDSRDLEELHSPTRSNHGDPLNDMVKHARRERKVQDLEITNASLEAINRSLERQLRKQTAELRRYKRLSRSGRLSSAPTAPPAEEPSEPTTGLGIEGVLDLSDLSEEEEVEAGGEDGAEGEGDLEDLEDSMFESSELDETDSAKSDPERDTRRRKRDEKRLQLDLTKHRELLVDSQKINQSIKKCLNWTEELIKEGKKALEYKVQPSEVKLPPRVLQPAYLRDNEDEESRKDGASAPSSPVDSPRSLTPNWSKEPQDRDSGIELPREGS